MNQGKLRVVHFLNQYFGQEGGEDRAGMQFLLKSGPLGPGVLLQKMLEDRGDVVATVVCGDNYFAENLDKACEQGIGLIASYSPALFFAGPAFGAGRYGMACGAFCKIVQEKLCIPAITGMYKENPGVEVYRRDVYIIKTGKSVGKMSIHRKRSETCFRRQHCETDGGCIFCKGYVEE
jgi:glycine reductase